MIEIVVVAGLVIAIVEVFKNVFKIPDYLYFAPVLLTAVALNAGNAYFFGEGIMTMKAAIVEGFTLGAQIAGIYGLGKPILEQTMTRTVVRTDGDKTVITDNQVTYQDYDN